MNNDSIAAIDDSKIDSKVDSRVKNSVKNRVEKAKQFLHYSVVSWVGIALLGQCIFAIYIIAVFVDPVVSGNITQDTFSHLIKGYVNNDTFGNIMMLAHIIPAALISVSGTLQIMPFVRKNFAKFHRYNGRFFLSLGLFGAISGLYLTWIRDTRLSDIGSMGITLNGLFIPIAVYFAWQYARQKRFDLHKRWAIHAFLLINGVWMFRLLLMSWFLANQGANGSSNTLDGPMDITFSFACYLLPMFIAECVMWAQRSRTGNGKRVYLTLCLSTLGVLITAFGVAATTLLMWSPRILGAWF